MTYWHILEPSSTVVEESNNPTFSSVQVPTVPEEDHDFVHVKHNFEDQFVCPEFTGKTKCTKQDHHGHVKK
eukprot:11586177-Ditylum_brightwellii.AAC.1